MDTADDPDDEVKSVWGAEAPPAKARLKVFLSYARVEAQQAHALAAAFERAGCEVWWDRHIAGGSAFAREIEVALARADIVAVLWSAASRASDWVRDEAAVGRDRGVLLPFRLDASEPPLGFRQTQSIDISAWSGAPDDDALLSAIRNSLDALGKRHRFEASHEEAPGGYNVGEGSHHRLGGVYQDQPPLVAVLPFIARGAIALSEHLAQALSDEVLDTLACVAGLRVLGRASAEHISEMKADPDFARERLQVSWLLEGSVTQATPVGSDIAVSVRLINTATREQAWTARFKRPSPDIIVIHEDIVDWVRHALLGSGSDSGGLTQPRPKDETNVDVVVARHLMRLRQPEALDRALALSNAVIATHPTVASAYATRALSTILASYYAATPVRNSREIARAARLDAEAAVRLAPNSSESFDALAVALHYGGDQTKAIASAERAVALNPNDPEARLHLGTILAEDAQFDRAIGELGRAAELDPLWPVPVVSQLLICEMTGDERVKSEVADRFRSVSGDEASRWWVSAAEANASGKFAHAIRCSSSAIQLNSALRYAVASRDQAREALFLTASANSEPQTFVAQGRRIAEEVVARALSRGDTAWNGSQFSKVFATAFVTLNRDDELIDLLRSRFGHAAGYEAGATVIEQALVAIALAFERSGSHDEATRLRQTAADHLLRAEAGGMTASQTAVAWASLHARNGQSARAIRILNAGFDQSRWAIARGPVWLGDSPLLVPLRDDPGFTKLLQACADCINNERSEIGEAPLLF